MIYLLIINRMENTSSSLIELQEYLLNPRNEEKKIETIQSYQDIQLHTQSLNQITQNSAKTNIPVMVEQQRLQSNNINQANELLSITCPGCKGLLKYPSNTPIIGCQNCGTTTATIPLIKIICIYCRYSSYYSLEHTHVKCMCGAIYSIKSK